MDTGALFVMLKNVLMFVLLAVPGYVMARTGALKQEASAPLSRLLMNVGLPFLVLSGTADKLELTGEVALEFLLVFLLGAAFLALTAHLSRPLTAGEKDVRVRGMMRFAAVFNNNGFLGVPLAAAVFGSGRVLTLVVILNVVNNVLMNTLGVYLVTGDKSSMKPKKALLNPVLIAFLLGILLNLLKVRERVPEAMTYCNYFSGIVTPVSMTVIGVKLASVRFRELFTGRRVWYVSFLRLILFPALAVGAAFLARLLFPGGTVDADWIRAAFIGFSMPTAALATAFADEFQGDADGAVKYTLGTTVWSALTIPLLYALLCAAL